MTGQAFPDEILMAYADGELDAATARSVEAALDDDALRERLALFTHTGDLLSQAASENPPDPIPAALMARVTATLDAARAADTVVPFQPKTTQPTPEPQRWRPMALAASLALAVGLGTGFGIGWNASPDGSESLGVALLDAEGLSGALSEMASGERRTLDSGEVAVIASFLSGDGALCREFEFDSASGGTIVSVVCRDGAGWDTRLAVAAASSDETGYAPASSLDTLESYLSAIEAGPALSAEDEAAMLRNIGG